MKIYFRKTLITGTVNDAFQAEHEKQINIKKRSDSTHKVNTFNSFMQVIFLFKSLKINDLYRK